MLTFALYDRIINNPKPLKNSKIWGFFKDAPAGTRTPDTRLKRAVLYLLSYWGLLAEMAGLEPTISESKSGVLPLHYISKFMYIMGWDMGLEPTTPGTTIRCSTN